MTAAAAARPQVAPALVDFFHLREQPFGVTPDPAYLYLSRTHREAFSSLLSGVHADRGFLALIAAPGLGKTTLLYRLMEELRESALALLLFQTQCDVRQLFQYILGELGIKAEGMGLVTMHRRLNEVLFDEMMAGKRVVLIVDESQNLGEPVLETLRMLSNFETPHAKLLQIVLAGQPDLAAKLAQPCLTQLRQRIVVASQLSRLTAPETANYVEHRLSVAGCDRAGLFTADALALIAQTSQGVPRHINTICFDAMSAASASGCRNVTSQIVRQVVTRQGQEGLAEASPAVEAGVRWKFLIPAPQARYEAAQGHPQHWIFRKFRDAQVQTRAAARSAGSAPVADPEIRPRTPRELPFGSRDNPMTKTAVAPAIAVEPVKIEPSVGADPPVIKNGGGTRSHTLFNHREDALRLAARMRGVAAETDRVFLLAGVTASEGVDEVAAGISFALAHMEHEPVLLVDADLRVPSLHRRFDVNLSPGLSELRAATMNGESLHAFGNGEPSLLTAGNKADPVALFSSQEFSALIKKLREKYRFILLKAPPVLSSAEINLLARSADGVVLVVPEGKQRKPEVVEAKRVLADLKAKIIGAVLCQEAARNSARRS
jgi:type II secretory pathway predicted ATPase ExeA/Mrp family chromosome partitioning ATPase